MNLGILIVSITILGGISNWLNWRCLNYSVVRLLYYLGAVVHELSHAIVCFLTGADIAEIKIFSERPHVIYSRSKLPIIGGLLISLAPIIGGLLLLFLINQYFLSGYFKMPQFSDWYDIFVAPFNLLLQINLFDWRNWLMILLFLNVGAMIGPSWQDLKNIWPVIIILFFFKWPFLMNLSLLVVILILTNILIQIFLIIVVRILKITKT